eukprot:5613657-Pleurochrysis_carterae.AAC.1
MAPRWFAASDALCAWPCASAWASCTASTAIISLGCGFSRGTSGDGALDGPATAFNACTG